MKGGPVMPDVERGRASPCKDIRLDPMHLLRGEIRLISADLLATLRGDSFLSCGHEDIRLLGMAIAVRHNGAGTPSGL